MRKAIWVKCKRVMEYSQQITVTPEEYELIRGLDLNDVQEGDPEYRIIDSKIDWGMILDADYEITDVQITEE